MKIVIAPKRQINTSLTIIVLRLTQVETPFPTFAVQNF